MDEQKRFEELLGEYLQALRRLAWAYTRDGAEGDDLVQEIAMALWTALPRLRGDSSERTWVYRVAHNTALSFVTGARKRAAFAGELKVEPRGVGDPEKEVLEREKMRRMWEAIRELPLGDRQLIVLYLEGMSAAEMEVVTGVSAGNVATRLTRIRQRMAARLRGAEVGG